MEKETLDRYKIRDYYMIPTEIVDNIFYEFETQLKKQKEIIDRAREYVKPLLTNYEDLNSYCILSYNKMILLEILEDKEV